MKKLIAQHNVQGQFHVIWYMTLREYVVVYGFDVSRFQLHQANQAAHAFGEYVAHQCACDGRFER